MFDIEITPYDKKIYDEYIEDFLPGFIIDMHVHIWEKSFNKPSEAKGCVTWTNRVASECT